MEPTDAVDLCERILKDLDEIPEKGWDFAESVREKVYGIKDWILEHDKVTEPQADSLKNMKEGVDKWLP